MKEKNRLGWRCPPGDGSCDCFKKPFLVHLVLPGGNPAFFLPCNAEVLITQISDGGAGGTRDFDFIIRPSRQR